MIRTVACNWIQIDGHVFVRSFRYRHHQNDRVPYVIQIDRTLESTQDWQVRNEFSVRCSTKYDYKSVRCLYGEYCRIRHSTSEARKSANIINKRWTDDNDEIYFRLFSMSIWCESMSVSTTITDGQQIVSAPVACGINEIVPMPGDA